MFYIRKCIYQILKYSLLHIGKTEISGGLTIYDSSLTNPFVMYVNRMPILLLNSNTTGIYFEKIQLLLFYLQPVKSLSVYSNDGTLRDKRIRIYILYQPEYLNRLTFVGKYYKHFYIVLAIPSYTIEYGHSAVGLFGYTVGNLFVVFRENKELYGLTGAIYNIVQNETDDKQRYEAEYHSSPVIENEITRTDDDNVTDHDHAS